ncbi:receptor-type tyrosine-protein phosphatase delta-like [Mercenaria mercenaria]|uniref:receptor-type tyrosine-protein phosphatase delta-like n=1 Tax=Mercenaria mercenaria TaxID=6596 RepID=UPI00234EFD88|nr:receptor-type tyrosine-protein phosphatase delta-like [Mercenaria mercenaria]
MTGYVYNMIPDKGSSTMSFFVCLRKFWIITIIIHQAFLSTAALRNPPVKLTASEITPSSLKLSWKPGNQDDISYIVQYKAKQHPGDFHEIKSIKKTEYTIEKMEAYQQYELRAIAVTKSGRSSPSASLEVVTGELAPSSALRNVRARPQDMQTIRIDWDEPEIPNGIIQGYKIFYTTNPDLPVVLWMNQEVAGENKMTTISDLIPNNTYTICVLAYSSMGQGPLSVPVQVMTRQEVRVPLQPRNLRARPISPNEIEITWDAPEDIDQVVDYTLYYNDSQKHTNNQVRVLPPTTKYILTDLVPDTIYHIQLAARSSRGLGVRTILVQAKTPEFIPNEPERVQVQAVNATTIYVEWQPPRPMDRKGTIRGYYVYYAKVDQNNNVIMSTEKIEDVNDGNKNEAVITDLLPNTRYQVTVAGYTRRGDGVRSRPKIINTMEAVDETDKEFSVDEVTVKVPSTSDNCAGKSNQSELSAGGNAEGELQEPKSSQSQSKAKTLKELKMEYYQQAIAGLKVQTECFAKVSKLADVLIAKFSST